jgi:hypothetical protein
MEAGAKAVEGGHDAQTSPRTGPPGLQRRSVCSMTRRKMCSTAVAICGL